MVNTTQFYKSKVALAVVLSLGLAACGDSEGDAGSTTNSVSDTVVEAVDNTVEHVAGTGSVQGTVLDTNGGAIMGAMVSLAGQTVETDASGYYYFTNVPAPGVDGVNADEGNDVDIESNGYNITITGPDGYASAIVKVIAEDIQVDSGNNGSNDGAGDVNNAGEQTTWFDGFLAQADTAKLPMFSAAVTGVLRNCYTGAALPAGVKVAADYAGLAATNTNPGDDTDVNGGVTIGIPVTTVMTDENGMFSFDSLPIDSSLTLTVEGYTSVVDAGTATELTGVAVDTTREGVVENLGDIQVCAITSSDTIAPHISSVGSTISENTSEGFQWNVLSEGVDGTQGIVIRFNEALNVDAIDVDAVIVTSQVNFNNVGAGEKVETVDSVIVADDGLSMTVTLAAALPEKTKFSIWMPRHQYEDASANRIVTGDPDSGETEVNPGNDDLVVDAAGNTQAVPAVPAVPAVVAAAASQDVGLDIVTSLSVTADTVGVAGNGLTLNVVDVAGPIAVTLTATGVQVTFDSTIPHTLNDVVTALNADPAASALFDFQINGVAATDLTAGFAQSITLIGGLDAAAAVAAVPAIPAVPTGSSEFGSLSSDTINASAFKTEYVRTRLCTYIPPITNPGTIEGEQLVKQVVAADDDIDAVGVFWDNGGTATISNLNGQHGPTEDVLQELWDRKNPISAQTIVDNTAVITGDLNDAISIISSKGVASSGAGEWSVVVPNTKHGAKVTITPTAAFNIIGTPITVTLEDKVAPTTVIQDSYNYADTFGADYVNAVAADAGYANGGELSEAGTSGSEGSPILYVTPRLFAEDVAGDDDANFNNRFDVFGTLVDGNTLNDEDTPAPYVTSTTNFVYDVNAFANWAAVSADVGVAFSENVDLNAGETVDFMLDNAAANTTLTGFVANNGLRNEDYIANDADQDGYHTYLTHGIIQMTTNDVVGLANLDHDAVIDYTGAVLDTVNDNVALSDSLVVIADAIPPFVTRAELTATEFVVTFNEAVTTTGGGALEVIDPDTGVVAATLNVTTAVASADNTVLTWSGVNLPPRAAFSNSGTIAAPQQTVADIDGVATFNGNPENETVTGVFSFPEEVGGDDLNHALLAWGSVDDARGNSWNDYHGLYTDAGVTGVANNGVIDSQEDADSATNDYRLALADIPMYLATDTIVPFGVEVQFGPLDEDGIAGVDGAFTITITATNPISMSNNAAPFEYVGADLANVGAEDGWRALGGAPSNVIDGWDLTEIASHFRIVNTLTLQADLQLDIANADTGLPGNNDGTVSVEEFVNSTTHANAAAGRAALLALYDNNDVDWAAGTAASFNADGTVLTINAVIAGNAFQQSTGYSFIKITPTTVLRNGAAVDPLVLGGNVNTNNVDDIDIRFGQIESTLEGTNGEEQSQDVRRSF